MGSILQNKTSLEDMLFEDVDACAVRMLRGEAEYQELKERRGELSQQNPFINELYDSDDSISLTAEQHRILREEMELSLAISQYERREYFWIGQQYVWEYLGWMNQRTGCGQEENEGGRVGIASIIGKERKGEKYGAEDIGGEQRVSLSYV